MMYHAIELQKALLRPATLIAEATSELLHHPRNPLRDTYLSRAFAANHELFSRIHRRYPKPTFGIDSIERAGVRVKIDHAHGRSRALDCESHLAAETDFHRNLGTA